ncbi:hypothetical protein KM043_017036 [Ampulex compressa]|nr:hypothetical protein KM043_017036 [Ampulex compressa]
MISKQEQKQVNMSYSNWRHLITRPITRNATIPCESQLYSESRACSSQIFVALAVPLEEPYKLISVAYFFEASYGLPSNSTYFEPFLEPLQRKRERRNINRAMVYRVLESKFESSGLSGRECLLRAICEASEFPLRHNGLIGDILHVLFTPTSSQQEQLPQDILDAELLGRNGTCTKYHPRCPLGLFDLIGVLE